ncbi:MAG: VWFA-related domain protein [Candidatus Sulfotelmatobacter sp.]|nr:VWFA-related domain protein [Candidatus Sulfotelmatobacter sp.]
MTVEQSQDLGSEFSLRLPQNQCTIALLPFALGGFLRRYNRALPFVAAVCIAFGVGDWAKGQQAPAASASPSHESEPITTFKVATRMVTIDVVAKGGKGNSLRDLKPDNFEVFEQIKPRREKYLQKIGAFRATSVAELAALDPGKPKTAPGVYTNLITMNRVPVPPTIILLDALNTDRTSLMQVRQQLVKMLSSIPDDVPTAVYLLGRRLEMLQSFTTDPKLLRATLEKIPVASQATGPESSPGDPDAASMFSEQSALDRSPDSLMDTVRNFQRDTFFLVGWTRTQNTIEAVRAIARHAAGYPGRKNLLWVASSFPTWFNRDAATSDIRFSSPGIDWKDVNDLASALADARIAVYPTDPGGLQDINFTNQVAMQLLADQTGGEICIYDNFLSDCVKKMVDDSSFFYEIAYYPNSGAWQGEFHKVIIKSKQPGIHLEYRQGYFAHSSDEKVDPKYTEKQFEQAACQDVLSSTSVLMVAKAFQEPEKVRYFVAVEPGTITFTPEADGTEHVRLKVGLCSFDKSGKPLRLLQDTIDEKLTQKQFAEVQAEHGFARVVSLVPTPGMSLVRVLIKDLPTGLMGSVNIPYTEASTASVKGPQ